MNRGHWLSDGHQSLLYRIGANCSSHVAAVGFIIHLALADNNLAYQILHIDARLLTFPHNDDLFIGRDGSAHAIDLLRIRVAHGLKENAVPLLPVLWKVLFMEHAALAGAAAHKYSFKCSHLISPPFLLTASAGDAADLRKE